VVLLCVGLKYLLFVIRLAPVFVRSHSGGLLEHTGEMLRVLEAQLIGNLADGFRGKKQLFFGDADDFVLYVLQGGLARFLLDEVAEIIGRQAEFGGTVFHAGQSFQCGIFAREILVEEGLETGQDVAMGILPGDELPFVEAQAIVEQQFDVVGDEPFAHPVDCMMQFLLNVQQAVDEDVALLFREMQGFVHLVREERVFLDGASEVGAANQVAVLLVFQEDHVEAERVA